jgi:transposase
MSGGHGELRGWAEPLPGVAGLEVIEVFRPDRKVRRFEGKSDPVDAEAAARAVLGSCLCSKTLARNCQRKC